MTQTLFRTLLLGTALATPLTAFAQQTTSSPTGPSIAQTPTSDENLDEVIAVGTFIPNEKQITSEITSVLDEDVFAQIGAGDIASALTRVTGLSLAQGKFVIVRGLNERYSNATLNGSPLPSPEPLRRVAPLDLFPTSILSDVVVQKTASPEFSGEFGGGAINLRTRGLPSEDFLEVSISGSANSETTLRRGFNVEGSDTDWIGFDDGLRDLPPLNELGEPTQNFDTFDTLIVRSNTDVPFNGGARLSGGKVFDLDSGPSIGVLATIGYDNSWQTRRGQDNTTTLDGDGIRLQNDKDLVGTENAISLNGLLSVGAEIDEDNTVTLVGFATRQSSSEVRVLQGFDNDDNEFQRTDFTEWFEREVYMGQLLGEHFISALDDAELNWRASYAVAGRDAPYERFVRYNEEGPLDDRFIGIDTGRLGVSNQVQFSELDDTSLDLGVDFVYPAVFGDREIDLKIGGAYLDKSRDSEQVIFRYEQGDRVIPQEFSRFRIDRLFSDALFENGFTKIDRLAASAGFPDRAESTLETIAGYVGFDTNVTDTLQVAGGVRYEDSEQTTAIGSILDDTSSQFDPLEESFWLPSMTATYTFLDNWQLRLAASKTINRPQFRELTPSLFINTDTNDQFIGNPFLQNSESTNLDARLEYYFAANQFFTVGFFYKDLTNPIEEILISVGEVDTTSFINAPAAEVYGIELEFEKKFGIPSDFGFLSDLIGGQDFVVRSNYTYSDSSVTAEGQLPIIPAVINPDGFDPRFIAAEGLYSDGRKLQGQSDHLANLQLGIENYEAGWDAFLLLNYTSERIRAVEQLEAGLPAINEQLPISLDFVVNVPFELRGGDYEFGFKIQNILDEKYEATQTRGPTTLVIDDYEIGTTFSASLKRRF
ncbi:TonB-dependent receptor [uncultured Algimonas sp.]|uniref:TonB-dependent receptor domain-containing protein n=1 Tax=uncultured Algimonas sp. TaxID=1547920 RepID=UPI002635E904|nr:TonB-dependent receptor [uncultured Algimonas sp.]